MITQSGLTKGDIVSHNIAETFELLFDKNNKVHTGCYRNCKEKERKVSYGF